MIPLPQANRLGLGTTLEHRGAAELQILDENDAIAIGEDGAVGILDDSGSLGNLFFRPFKAAGDTLPFVGVFKDFIKGAFGAGWFGHKFRVLEE